MILYDFPSNDKITTGLYVESVKRLGSGADTGFLVVWGTKDFINDFFSAPPNFWRPTPNGQIDGRYLYIAIL